MVVTGNVPASGTVRFGVLLLCMAMLGVAFACNGGYKLRVKKIENCGGPDAIITVNENFTVALTKNCNIKSRGCVHFKDFKTGNAKYTLIKEGIKILEDSIDICDQASRTRRMENIAQLLQILGIPEKCPISAGQICTEPTQLINVNRFKQQLHLLLGTNTLHINVKHDSGKSCFKILFDIIN